MGLEGLQVYLGTMQHPCNKGQQTPLVMLPESSATRACSRFTPLKLSPEFGS